MGPSRYDHPKIVKLFRRLVSCQLPLRNWRSQSYRILNIDAALEKQFGFQSVCVVNLMVKPNGLLVPVSSTHYCASTSGLSTKSSTWALLTLRLGDLILRQVSRLYAFSAYPNRTSLPSYASGETTGTQEVRPLRSSRTKSRPPQISYAHHR